MSPKSLSPSGINPEISNWTGPLGLPDFARIDDRDFGPAFDAALPAHLAEIDASRIAAEEADRVFGEDDDTPSHIESAEGDGDEG